MKVGFLGLLGLMFIGLKLAEIITWSWWLVLLPLYFPIMFILVVSALTFTFVYGSLLIKDLIMSYKQRKQKGE